MRQFAICLSLLVFAGACSNQVAKEQKFTIVKGKSDGYKYEIAYDSSADLKKAINAVLTKYSQVLNTDSQHSVIAHFNGNSPLDINSNKHYQSSSTLLTKIDSLCKSLHQKTNGAFNSSMHGLLQLWGFTANSTFPETVSATQVKALLPKQYGGLVQFTNGIPNTSNGLQSISYQVIYKGIVVDAIAEMFDSVYHLKNYYINFGGEIRAKGNNGNDSYWPISIEKPMFNTLKSIEFCKIPLKNYSLATENSYKNFFFYKGKRFSQNIDPQTGYPARNELLSATVLARSATEAKAFAAACMVIGLEKSIQLIQQYPDLKAILIFEKDNQIQYWGSSNLSIELSKQE
jgi:thiamine biosynthesis lipoprotein